MNNNINHQATEADSKLPFKITESINARPISTGHKCKVTSVRPKNPVFSHPFI